MAQCSSCYAQIRWVVTENKKSMPLDAVPTKDGGWVILEDRPGPVARPVMPLIDTNVTRWTAHWATCPNADQHRRGRG